MLNNSEINYLLLKTNLPIIFVIIFSLLVTPFILNSFAEEENLVCSEGKVLVYRTISDKYACVYPSTAEKWHTAGFSEPVQQVKSFDIPPTHAEKMRTAAPLPETSMGPQIDYSKGYLVEEIKDGLYWVTEGAYQVMFLTTGEGVIAIDAPPSIGENYLKAIAEVTDEPITHVIYSHTHNDHVGAMSMFPDDAVYIAHQEAADTLSKRNDPNRPLPTVTFEDTYTLEVGNQKLELAYYGPMHEPGNIFIYAPQQKVLMLVDVIFPGWTPFKDLAMAQDVSEFLAAHDKVLEYDFDTYIGGHLTRLGTPDDVQIQKEYFEDIQASAGKANQEVSFMAIGQEVGFSNPWLVFQIYADTITQQCADEVVPKWIDRLGGVDLFTYDHCWKISESQRID
jgi:glyoxylase-like metal-dependent hydrolase (beta-lactamase superfamily II)